MQDTLLDKLLDFVAKEVKTVAKFVSTPMGVYEFRDELIRNFRVLVNETIATVLRAPSRTTLLRG